MPPSIEINLRLRPKCCSLACTCWAQGPAAPFAEAQKRAVNGTHHTPFHTVCIERAPEKPFVVNCFVSGDSARLLLDHYDFVPPFNSSNSVAFADHLRVRMAGYHHSVASFSTSHFSQLPECLLVHEIQFLFELRLAAATGAPYHPDDDHHRAASRCWKGATWYRYDWQCRARCTRKKTCCNRRLQSFLPR